MGRWYDFWTPPTGDYGRTYQGAVANADEYKRKVDMGEDRKRRAQTADYSRRSYKYRGGHYYGHERTKRYRGGYFVNTMPYRRYGRKHYGKRRYGRKTGRKPSYGAKKRFRRTAVVMSRKKLAAEFDLTKHVIPASNGMNIIGGSVATHQVWNSIAQGVGDAQRLGIRANRTGLWINTEFYRDATQVNVENNWTVRVIFAKQKGESGIPTTGAAAGALPAWPTYYECFTREWKRSYQLLKDTKVSFLRPGVDITALNVTRNIVFKFKTGGYMGWTGSGDDMSVGRIYMYCVCPDTAPAIGFDLSVEIKHYCNWFVDQLG